MKKILTLLILILIVSCQKNNDTKEALTIQNEVQDEKPLFSNMSDDESIKMRKPLYGELSTIMKR